MSPKDARKQMVRRLKEGGVIGSDKVAHAMELVERHLFLPASMVDEAYLDTPLQIGEGQTISAPHMVAMMAEGLDLKPGLKVLEVGGGLRLPRGGDGRAGQAGWQGVQHGAHTPRWRRARGRNLKAAGYDGMVEVIVGDGTKGLPEHAPFDRISIAAAAPYVPEPLKQQLAENGRMLIPVGNRWYQDLTMVERKGERFKETKLSGCVFVPLIGEFGFKD